MDSIKLITIIIVIIAIFCIFNKQELYENFTNDEAIQNVASLYNSGLATVTNLTATGTGTITNLVAPTGNITNLTANNLTSPTANITNLTASNTNITNLNAATGKINNLSAPSANIGNLTVTASNIPVIPLIVSPIAINQGWTWDDQIWSPKQGVGNIIFPAISAKLRTVPVGAITIFAITGNPTVQRGQATILTYKISDTQYNYSPLQGQILPI